jgi:flagellar biosynthetic protein FliO
MNQLIAVTVVLALLGALAWLLRSGRFGRFSARASAVAVETAVSLGERRSLVIVAVEGRRLLLGVTGTQVSLVTELEARAQEAPRS